jgi:hypothetical protein
MQNSASGCVRRLPRAPPQGRCRAGGAARHKQRRPPAEERQGGAARKRREGATASVSSLRVTHTGGATIAGASSRIIPPVAAPMPRSCVPHILQRAQQRQQRHATTNDVRCRVNLTSTACDIITRGVSAAWEAASMHSHPLRSRLRRWPTRRRGCRTDTHAADFAACTRFPHDQPAPHHQRCSAFVATHAPDARQRACAPSAKPHRSWRRCCCDRAIADAALARFTTTLAAARRAAQGVQAVWRCVACASACALAASAAPAVHSHAQSGRTAPCCVIENARFTRLLSQLLRRHRQRA